MERFGVLDGLMHKNETGEAFSPQEVGLIRGAENLQDAQGGTDTILQRQLEISLLRESRAHQEMSQRSEEYREKEEHREMVEILNSPAFICGIVIGVLFIL